MARWEQVTRQPDSGLAGRRYDDVLNEPWVDHGLEAVLGVMTANHADAAQLIAGAMMIGVKIEYEEDGYSITKMDRENKTIYLREH